MKNIWLIVFLAVVLLNFSGFLTSINSDEKPIISIRMLDFESPVRLGDFMNFKYYLEGVSGINDAVNINFKIEKNEKIISSGSDIVYISDTQGKTITTKIFLPSSLESGVYKLKIETDYKNHSVESYRIIEIKVKDEFASIFSINDGNNETDLKIYIILVALILLAFLVMAIIYQFEKKKINEALIKEKKFIKKYKLSILTISLFLILGILIYYLKLINALLGVPIYFYYSFLGILLLSILIKVSSKKSRPFGRKKPNQ